MCFSRYFGPATISIADNLSISIISPSKSNSLWCLIGRISLHRVRCDIYCTAMEAPHGRAVINFPSPPDWKRKPLLEILKEDNKNVLQFLAELCAEKWNHNQQPNPATFWLLNEDICQK